MEEELKVSARFTGLSDERGLFCTSQAAVTRAKSSRPKVFSQNKTHTCSALQGGGWPGGFGIKERRLMLQAH